MTFFHPSPAPDVNWTAYTQSVCKEVTPWHGEIFSDEFAVTHGVRLRISCANGKVEKFEIIRLRKDDKDITPKPTPSTDHTGELVC